jgi:peptide/nickel transport system ATP-binding protein
VSRPLLELQDLRVEFATPCGTSRAVRGVDLRLRRGEIHGLVGESGCGKSLTARAVLRLLPGSASLAGRILLDGEDILGLSDQELSRVRGRRVAMVFQNPMEALNPVFTLGQQLAAVLRHHGVAQGRGIRERAVELLADVGLPEPRAMLSRYPHQLSGGMQQRAMIAVALAPQPELIIADEPTTALDVTIQAQILDLLKSLRDTRGISVLLISHDMGVVAETCDRVAILYAGRVVEEGLVRDVFHRPAHPYTQGLLAALPGRADGGTELPVIPGSVPSGLAVIAGCSFAPRCPEALPACGLATPEPISLDASHDVACILYPNGGRT